MNDVAKPVPVYVFVVWSRGMDELGVVMDALRGRFSVLRQFDVSWRPRDFVRNLAAFYGWKSYTMWLGKKWRSGTGRFRAIVVRDERPGFRPAEKDAPPELLFNDGVYGVKTALRGAMRRSNVVHASVNEAETRHNLMALTGQTLEEFLARPDLDGSVSPLVFESPMPYAAYPHAEKAGKGPRFVDGELRLNRVAVFLLPRCGVPTVFSFSFRILSLFSFAFCVGRIKMGFRQTIS